MRHALAVLAVSLGLAADAAAQTPVPTPVPTDLAISGAATPGAGTMDRTLRFTVVNNGPAPYDGALDLGIQIYPLTQSVADAGGCTPTGYGVLCHPATPLGVGESREFAVRVAFQGLRDFDRDQVIGSIAVYDGAGRHSYDTNPSNDQVKVDMGITAPPPALKLEAVVPGFATHGKAVTHMYILTNPGGVDLTDVRVTDDRCSDARVRAGDTTLQAGVFLERLLIECTYMPPPHRKGERPLVTHIRATAMAGGVLLSQELTRTTYLQEPRRPCGSFAATIKGKRTRWKTVSSVPDLGCAQVRRRLRACLTRGRAPAAFRCTRGGKAAVLARPNALGQTVMIATRI